MKSNFAFLEKLNPEAYQCLYKAESQVRIDYNIGNNVRKALEAIIYELLRERKLSEKAEKAARSECRKWDLFDKIYALQNTQFLTKMGWLKQGQKVSQRPFLPPLGTISYMKEDHTADKSDGYTFLRRFGNQDSHIKNPADTDPKIQVLSDYPHAIRALKVIYKLLYQIYQGRVEGLSKEFHEEYMPIGSFHVDKAYVPNDQKWSGCKTEFLAHHDSDGDERNRSYAILRLYEKDTERREFLKHKIDAIHRIKDLTPYGIRGMSEIREICPMNNPSPFYIIAYIFPHEPIPLSDALLQSITMKNRLQICTQVCYCLKELHDLNPPIYYRMLSYDSIYLCNYSQGEQKRWAPYLANFDFAKIIENDGVTVLPEANDSLTEIREQKRKKYIPPQTHRWETYTDREWRSVDVYSLGMLFADILSGKIQQDLGEDVFEKLEEDLSDEFLSFIEKMVSDRAEDRPDTEDVLSAVRKEDASWN